MEQIRYFLFCRNSFGEDCRSFSSDPRKIKHWHRVELHNPISANVNPANTRRCFDVDLTSFDRYGRQMDVETTLCANVKYSPHRKHVYLRAKEPHENQQKKHYPNHSYHNFHGCH